MTMKSRGKTSCWIIFVFALLFIFGSFIREVRCLTVEEEKKLGKKVLLEVEKSMPIVRDPTLQSFVDTLGDSLVKEAGPTREAKEIREIAQAIVKGPEPPTHS